MAESNEAQRYRAGISRARWMIAGLASAALIAGIIGTYYQDRGMAVELAPPTTRIEYQVTGTSPDVTVTYVNDLAYTESKQGAPPWKYGFRARKGRELSVIVQNNAAGTTGCAIRAGGQELAAVTDSTESTIRCTAVVP